MAIQVPIIPETLRWAMNWANLKEEALAKSLNVRPEKIRHWLNGTEKPTYSQARKLADLCHIAFSQLLLPPPEQIELPLKDFRRGLKKGNEPSQELVEAVYDALRKHDWWREYRRNTPLPFFQNWLSNQYEVETIKQAILQIIPIQELQRNARSWQDFLRLAVEKIEDAGILVLRQGYVGTNTRRVFDPKEFSGFVIADRVAPIIFLNTQDPLVRQIFTLMHELVHVWIGESVLDAELEDSHEPDEHLERLCDQVAAELLMPEADFKNAWNGEPYEQAQRAAKVFKVSAWATLKRALELNLISYDEYAKTLQQIQKNNSKMKQPKGSGNFWLTFEIRNSRKFVRTVLDAALCGEISSKEMASLLNLRLPTAMAFMERSAYVPS
ncbi:XRE family transcriptional regulator [Carboxydocella sp. ULO1]|uniref:XRE family transcriptional regulator n=1 Tax=Carboxydocella sp. ULO1 TaxID=1926599 RepID=UPI0009AED61C|nr:XRE family transcriptional regulator [Carboxydocella sp. ULO1]GAW28946.1 Zn peptidase [Carboxydocella sp. ULO1]